MIEYQYIFILILINFLSFKSIVLYFVCGTLFVPFVSKQLSDVWLTLYTTLCLAYNTIAWKYLPNYQIVTDGFRSAKRVSFGEIEERESDVTGTEVDPTSEYLDDEPQPFLPHKEHVQFKGATVVLPGGANQFYALVNDRRSVRNFSKKPVDYEIIRKCIQAAGTSPSGAHTEPWTFCVIENIEIKTAIRDIIEREEYENYTHRMSRQWTADLQPLKTDYRKEYLSDAPYLILIFKQIYGLRDDGTKKQHYYNEISTSIATGILLCALQAAGLNSLVTTPLNCGPALRTLLDRPSNEKLHVLLPVGYAADDCKIPDLQRKPVDDILVKF